MYPKIKGKVVEPEAAHGLHREMVTAHKAEHGSKWLEPFRKAWADLCGVTYVPSAGSPTPIIAGHDMTDEENDEPDDLK